jgi:hypothetical protein
VPRATRTCAKKQRNPLLFGLFGAAKGPSVRR